MRNFTVPGCPVAEDNGQKLRVRGGIENDLIVEGRSPPPQNVDRLISEYVSRSLKIYSLK